jgi:hypothetical protein
LPDGAALENMLLVGKGIWMEREEALINCENELILKK